MAFNNCCFALLTSRHKNLSVKRLFAPCSCLVFCLVCMPHTPFLPFLALRVHSKKGLILQVNLSLSQQRQTSQWEKSMPPWWSWSTTGRAKSSAPRPFVTSRYCALLVQWVHLVSSKVPVGVERSHLTGWANLQLCARNSKRAAICWVFFMMCFLSSIIHTSLMSVLVISCCYLADCLNIIPLIPFPFPA